MNDEMLSAVIANVELLRLASLGLARDNAEAQALADYAQSVIQWLSQQREQQQGSLH